MSAKRPALGHVIAAGEKVPASDSHSSRGSVLVGVMSGTSADGISVAVTRFARGEGNTIECELLGYHSLPYTPLQRARLLLALEHGVAADYCRLNFEMGEWLAAAALAALAGARIDPHEVRAIASHGHTVWHDPGHSTWQFGESAVIAEQAGIGVVSDFRVRDVAAGGQGAPLVAIADAHLFSSATEWRALQNLGGIANVSVVPPAGALHRLRAFDTGPGCAVIDGVVRTLDPSLPYDVGGALARTGRPIEKVVRSLLAEPYFRLVPPKSTGRELFSAAYIEHLIAACRDAHRDATAGDIVATAVALTAGSIADAYGRFVPEPVGDVLLSGGGARNPALVDAITTSLAPRRVRSFDDEFFDAEAKEAVAFALLGWLHLEALPGNVPSATGARGPRILGKWTPA